MYLLLLLRYGLPVNFQAMLLLPLKKQQRRLREELNRLYEHLDNTALTAMDVSMVHMYASICLSVCLCLSVSPCLCLSFCLFVFFCLSVSIFLSIFSLYIPAKQYFRAIMNQPVCLSFHQSLSIHLCSK